MVSARAPALFVCVLVTLFCTVSASCSDVKHVYTEMGFNPESVPENYTTDVHLRVCEKQNWTCCSAEMEQNLVNRSTDDFLKIVDEVTENLRNTFESRHKRFDDFFLDLLNETEHSLNLMFTRTYGDPYMQNADIFHEMFLNLKRYYLGGNVNLEEIINNFWTCLMERMFQLLNSQYNINDDYMECVNKQMDELKPFGETPKILKAQVTKAFVSARTFVEGLKLGKEIVNNATQVGMSSKCISDVTDMLYCVYCQGLITTKPCAAFCKGVMSHCLNPQIEISFQWKKYIDAMLLMVERLEGPINIESVMETIDVKISDAIMNMQDKTMEISYQVFGDCGQPKLLEKNRSSRAIPDQFDAEYLPNNSSGTSLQKLVSDVKQKLVEFRLFWESLPILMCNHKNVSTPEERNEGNCWNGRAEFWETSSVSGFLNQGMMDFSTLIANLNQVYSGQQLQSDDSSYEMESGSGSGVDCVESCDNNPNLFTTDQPGTKSSTRILHPSCTLILILVILTLICYHR
ncbi:glypican-6b [Trichomycterus rosablanca]|uniref:glypican-6b n=1 Tax=Trichomycterus rosablanca TaxID=2290929 RepID=UPI002F34FC69